MNPLRLVRECPAVALALALLMGAGAGFGLARWLGREQQAPTPAQPEGKVPEAAKGPPPPPTREDLDNLLQSQVAAFVKERRKPAEAIDAIYFTPILDSAYEPDRKRFLLHELSEDRDHPMPVERIRTYDEFVVWCRPVSEPGAIWYLVVGWTTEGPEVFYCRYIF